MIVQVYEIDGEGFINEVYVSSIGLNGEVEDDDKKHCISTTIPDGLFKPKWNGTTWIEGATPEEIEELTRVEPSPPTELELLKQENLLLKAQVQANADRADFHEELIVELATLVIP